MSVELRRARPSLGTVVGVTCDDPAGGYGGAAIEGCFAAVERVQRVMSFHNPTSDLSKLNRAGRGAEVTVDPWLVTVLAAALELHRCTGGLFDPGIAPHLVRRGVLPPSVVGATGVESSIAGIEVLDGCTVRKRGDAVIDLGGIAKGFAVDRGVDALRSAGVRSGVVNAGGDLRVFGEAPRSVSLRHPVLRRVASAPLAVCEAAVCSSVSDRAVPQCIDPYTGAAPSETIGATVMAPSALWADGLTKVAMLAGGLAAELAAPYGASLVYLERFGESALFDGEEARVCA